MPLFRILRGHRHAKHKFMVIIQTRKKHGLIVRVFNLNDFSIIFVNVKFLRWWCKKITA